MITVESFMNRQLKSFDIFRKVPKDHSQGSYLGLLMTVVCFVVLVVLVSNEIYEYISYSVEKGFIVDHKLENDDVQINLSIVFRRMPCHLLGLDIVDYIGTHEMNLHEKLNKQALDRDGNFIKDMPYEFPEKKLLKDFKKALKEEQGCRLTGEFNVLLVPGNFHIGFHSFGEYLNKILNAGIQFDPNFEHHVEHLVFGHDHNVNEWHRYQKRYDLKEVNTLEGYDSGAMTPNKGPFSYHYKL